MRKLEDSIRAIPSNSVQEALMALLHDAQGDAVAFRRNVERWYDDQMERVSGWYRRRIQRVLWILAFAIAFALNADTLQMAKRLWVEPSVRASLVSKAENANTAGKDTTPRLDSLTVPLGWHIATARHDPQGFPFYKQWSSLWAVLSKLIGLTLIAVAISFGAPFWFDTLSKLSRLRNGGAPPPASDAIRRGEGEETRAGPGAAVGTVSPEEPPPSVETTVPDDAAAADAAATPDSPEQGELARTPCRAGFCAGHSSDRAGPLRQARPNCLPTSEVDMEFIIIDNCPVPKELADEIMQIKKLSGASLNSCDRSSDAEPFLAKFGKMSQRQLFDGFQAGKPGFNPANPPGFSTHERHNDGIAYPVARGARLEYWQVGMDWDNPPAVIKAAAKLGWIVTTTYPTSKREVQHLNFRKEPETEFPIVHEGDTGPAVQKMTRVLATVKSPVDHKPYLPQAFPHYGPKVVAALKKFQKEHHQKPDGKMGPQTATQLAVAKRQHAQDPIHH